MLANRLVEATNQLVVTQVESVRQFRRVIREILGVFLRFSHRYFSHQLSDHGQVKDLYRLISDHLGTDRLTLVADAQSPPEVVRWVCICRRIALKNQMMTRLSALVVCCSRDLENFALECRISTSPLL